MSNAEGSELSYPPQRVSKPTPGPVPFDDCTGERGAYDEAQSAIGKSRRGHESQRRSSGKGGGGCSFFFFVIVPALTVYRAVFGIRPRVETVHLCRIDETQTPFGARGVSVMIVIFCTTRALNQVHQHAVAHVEFIFGRAGLLIELLCFSACT